MSYHSQLDDGFSVYNCDFCGEYFWLKPATAQRATSAGHRLGCHTCAAMKFENPIPYPFARRLMPGELEELKEEERTAAEKAERDKPLPLPEPEADPDEVEITERRTTEYEDRIRRNLKNSLLHSGVTAAKFGKCAGFGKKAEESITRFIDGTGQRATRSDSLQKIIREMRLRNWLQDGDAQPALPVEPVAEAEPTAAPAAELPKEQPIAVPYPDANESAFEGREVWKKMANSLTVAKTLPHNKGKEEEIDTHIRKAIREVERPDGDYKYDHTDLHEANPIHKLTQEEKLHCIRTLPIPIAQKLFPHL